MGSGEDAWTGKAEPEAETLENIQDQGLRYCLRNQRRPARRKRSRQRKRRRSQKKKLLSEKNQGNFNLSPASRSKTLQPRTGRNGGKRRKRDRIRKGSRR